MKRLAGVLAGLLLAAACAHIEAPTGGPEDNRGPQLLTTRPDTFARVTDLRSPAVFVFDEGLSEQRVEESVSVSPRTSGVAIDRNGDELRVSLRRGWEPNRIYQIVIDSMIQDRFNNRVPEPIRLVFSTGPEIPETFLSGTVLERQTGQPAKNVRVEAILRPDSLVYATRTDAEGTFAFAQIPAGEYQVRAFNDPNANRSLEGFEARDTTVARVAAGAQPSVELSLVTPDTSAPRALEATLSDSSVAVRFDDFLDPDVPVSPAQVTLLAPDSSVVRVASVIIGSDSATGPRESAAPRDSARRDTAAARDTAATRPRRPVPSRTLTFRTATALLPDAQYTVRVTRVRNLVGLVGGGEVRLRTPRAAPPAAAPPAPGAPTSGTPAPRTPAPGTPAPGTPAPGAPPAGTPPAAPNPPTNPAPPRP